MVLPDLAVRGRLISQPVGLVVGVPYDPINAVSKHGLHPVGFSLVRSHMLELQHPGPRVKEIPELQPEPFHAGFPQAVPIGPSTDDGLVINIAADIPVTWQQLQQPHDRRQLRTAYCLVRSPKRAS